MDTYVRSSPRTESWSIVLLVCYRRQVPQAGGKRDTGTGGVG
eukprot:SAG25_NODE_1409_length_3097_cov_6.174906_7_plen_41_part_01